MKLGHIDLEPCSYMIVYERINKNGDTSINTCTMELSALNVNLEQMRSDPNTIVVAVYKRKY